MIKYLYTNDQYFIDFILGWKKYVMLCWLNIYISRSYNGTCFGFDTLPPRIYSQGKKKQNWKVEPYIILICCTSINNRKCFLAVVVT